MVLLTRGLRKTFALPALVGLALVVTAQASKAHSDGELYSPAFETCIKQSGGVTAQMVDCIRGELVIQDAKLNQAYRQSQKKLSKERRDQLTKAQRAWIIFRDANCAFYFDPEGGTMARLDAEQCILSATAYRVKELEGF